MDCFLFTHKLVQLATIQKQDISTRQNYIDPMYFFSRFWLVSKTRLFLSDDLSSIVTSNQLNSYNSKTLLGGEF